MVVTGEKDHEQDDVGNDDGDGGEDDGDDDGDDDDDNDEDLQIRWPSHVSTSRWGRNSYKPNR